MRSGALRTPTTRPATARVGVTVAASVALVLGTHGAVGAQEAPFDRGIADACRSGAQAADAFEDVPRDTPHAGAIDCLWASTVVQGSVGDDGGFEYRPNRHVTRQQMATFTANALGVLPDRYYEVPEAEDPTFTDTHRISLAHRSNVASVHEAGIVSGYEDGTFRPQLAIDRAQMASFIARTIEGVTGEELPREDAFDDVDGVHAENVGKLAAIGVVQGDGEGSYHPDRSTTRAQMATFVARSLDALAAEGFLVPMSYGAADDGARQVLTEVELGQHDDHDRAAISADGDDGQLGWQVRYTDDPVAHGSGQAVDVEGDAVLEVVLTGTAPETELDDPSEAWDGETITLDGEGIIQVESVGWYEGRHQLFIGTTGLHWFDVDRLYDREGVLIDVSHG